MRYAFCLVLLSANTLAAEPESYVGCRQIVDDSARLRCYDAAADALLDALRGAARSATPADTRPAPESPAASAAADTGAASPPAAPPADVTSEGLFGKEKAATERVIKEVLGVEQTSSVTSPVKSATRNPLGKMQVVLENGQIWAQIDDGRLTLHEGDVVVIRTASLGSFLLEKASGSRKIRVKRID